MNDLTTHSKTLHPNDFALLEPEIGFFRNLRHDLRDVPVDLAHECRYWEYALALRCALRHGGKTVLDVGGGAGLFSAGAAKCGFGVTHLEVGYYKDIIDQHARVIDRPIRVAQADMCDGTQGTFDVVACLSVIEHVSNASLFFEKALVAVNKGGLFVLTTDFHDSGEPQVEGHLRSYNETQMHMLEMEAGRHGFDVWGGAPDWSYFGQHVYQYNFASLVLERT